MESTDPIFEPLKFRNLTVKNRLTRSSITGRIDNYDGSGTQARINWESKFARGGVGMIMSAHIPIHIGGRIIPNVATIESDATIPFWRRVGAAVHRHECAYVAQLSHSGRQQDLGGLENEGIGLQLGRGQAGAALPAGVPAQVAATVQRLAHEVFAHGFLIAYKATVYLAVAVLLVAAASCVLVAGDRRAVTAPQLPAKGARAA